MEDAVLQVKRTLWLQPCRKAILKAAQIISDGGLVAFPTETVYGLGASAVNSAAVRGIYAAKGRPSDNPLIVHVADQEQVDLVAASVPERARFLMERFWPGPLSLILPRSNAVPDLVSAGLPTVAVRMPDHPVALQLIQEAGVPVAAPSANRSGRPSPTNAIHVLSDLAGRIDAVLDGGICRVGLESTVLDLSGPYPVILRPGGVAREALSSALGEPVRRTFWKGETAPPSPGMKYRHYAPRAPLILVTGSRHRRERLIEKLADYYRGRGIKVCFLNRTFGMNQTETGYKLAGLLYRELRRCDEKAAGIILAEAVNVHGIGAAVMNRLGKAAVRIIRV